MNENAVPVGRQLQGKHVVTAPHHQKRRLVAETIFNDLVENMSCLPKGAGEVVRQRFLIELPVVQKVSVDTVPQAQVGLLNEINARSADDRAGRGSWLQESSLCNL